MKRIIITSVFAILVLCSAALVPGKTKEKDIIGKWKFHLDISKAIEEETKDEDGWGAVFAKGIGHLVDEIVEEVDITFDFQKNNILVVTTDSNFDDDDRSVETYRWKINKKGYVVTTSTSKKNKSFQDSSDGWRLTNGKLIPVDEDDLEGKVWMEKL
jgi:hypothetical protein